MNANDNNNFVDIGNLCVDCGRDTTFGSGLFVNRIPSDRTWNVNDEFEVDVDGWLCCECAELECSVCKNKSGDYEIRNGVITCEDCLENSND